MHELVWLWDGHATCQKKSKHNVILQEMCFHQWYWHCAWKANNARLTRILYFLQRCCLFPRMLYFLLSILEKKKCPDNEFDACNEFCIVLLYILAYRHICVCTLFDKIIGFVHSSFMFLEKCVFDTEQTWVQFPAAHSAFSEKCYASFHAVHECFSQKHHLYFALKVLPCWKK